MMDINEQKLLDDWRRYLLEELYAMTGSSKSSKPKVWFEEINQRKIICPKGTYAGTDFSFPVEIVSREGAVIVDYFCSFDSTVETSNYKTATNVINAMKKSYDSEDSRVQEFLKFLNSGLNYPITITSKLKQESFAIRSNSGPDGFIDCCDCPMCPIILFFEGKLEVGSSGDPTVQSYLDYTKYAGKMAYNGIEGNFPAILLTLSGNFVNVHFGIIQSDCTSIISLIDGLILHDVEKVARFINQLNQSIEVLVQYYSTQVNTNTIPGLPYLQKISTKNGEEVQIKYQHLIKKSNTAAVFAGEIVGSYNDGLPVIIKFTKKYSKEAHEILLENSTRHNRLVPTILASQKLPGGWMVIVMERILNPLRLSKIVFLPLADKISIFEDIVTAVRRLHERNFVHGDLRWPNILVTENPIRAYLIDFDISGSEGIAKYPFNLDLESFDWLSQDDINGFVTKAHDLSALAELKVGLRIRDNR